MTAVLDTVMDTLTAPPEGWVRQACRDTEARLAAARRANLPPAVILTATAAVRLAERTIGLTIRAGQQAGEIRRQAVDTGHDKPGPAEAAGLARRDMLGPLYALAEPSDEAFLAAIDAARREGNLSRASVRRKLADGAAGNDWIPAASDHTIEAAARRREVIRDLAVRGYSSRQISEQIGTTATTIRRIAREQRISITADEVIGGTHRRPVGPLIAARDTIIALAGLADGVDGLSLDGLGPAEAQAWAGSLTESLRVLTRFATQIRETP